jgi:endonuclease/exonuclease/phosphatase (EEP) superfamily protein YafD
VRVRWSNVVLLLALPALPPAVAPFFAHWHWTVDQLACFPVQAMAWLAISTLLLAAARRWWLALVLAAGAALAAASVLPGWLRSPPAASSSSKGVRVLVLNLLRGAERNAERALALVRAHDPDVLFCSEVTPAWLEALADRLPALPHRCVRTDEGYFGVALFSRWPLQGEVVPLGVDWAPALRAVVATPGGPLGVLGVHTPRPGGGERCRLRDLALAAIPQTLASMPPACVVLGDFNATPWNHGFRELLAVTGLRCAADGGWQPTWPSALPWPLRVPIDHVLLGGGVAVARYEAGPDFGSDHLPLVATLVLP